MLFSQCRTTPMNIRWLKFHFQLTINAETTLSHQRWINVILSMLFQRCFVNVETTSINIRQLNFHSTKFQPWNNIGSSTLNRYNSINSIIYYCFPNVETTSINVRRLNFHFQPNINAETTLITVDDQRCFNVDSMLICLLGNYNYLHPNIRRRHLEGFREKGVLKNFAKFTLKHLCQSLAFTWIIFCYF